MPVVNSFRAPAPPDAIIPVGAARDGAAVEVEGKMTGPQTHHASQSPVNDTEPGSEKGLIPKMEVAGGCD